jgi:hypothetical protein
VALNQRSKTRYSRDAGFSGTRTAVTSGHDRLCTRAAALNALVAERRTGVMAEVIEKVFVDCPAHLDPGGTARCRFPAQVRSRFTMCSTGGPLESVRIIRLTRATWSAASTPAWGL